MGPLGCARTWTGTHAPAHGTVHVASIATRRRSVRCGDRVADMANLFREFGETHREARERSPRGWGCLSAASEDRVHSGGEIIEGDRLRVFPEGCSAECPCLVRTSRASQPNARADSMPLERSPIRIAATRRSRASRRRAGASWARFCGRNNWRPADGRRPRFDRRRVRWLREVRCGSSRDRRAWSCRERCRTVGGHSGRVSRM